MLAVLTLTAAVILAACGDSRVPSDLRKVGPVLDLRGRAVDPGALARQAGTAAVLLFVRIDCPISNRYAPEVQRLAAAFAADGVRFYLVYPEPEATVEDIRVHLAEFGYDAEDTGGRASFVALRDPRQAWATATGAEVTPEAAVLDAGGHLVYRGRIDDRWVAFGQLRGAPTRRDLREVLTALAAGEPVAVRTTRALGCFIKDLS